MHELFGEVIYSYTRKEALADGVLVDVSELAKEAGIKFPVAVTAAVWAEFVTPDQEAKDRGESATGRLWDMLQMFRIKARTCGGSTMPFKVLATEKGKEVVHQLNSVIGPGDTPAPVITIMFPNED